MLLLLLFAAAPAMACAVPDAQLTAAERACCRMMKAQCGQMEMPASHSCCHKNIGSASHKALTIEATSFQPTLTIVAVLPALFSQLPPSLNSYWIEKSEYPPPISPPAAIFILRI
jgi:hypothetical protein